MQRKSLFTSRIHVRSVVRRVLWRTRSYACLLWYGTAHYTKWLLAPALLGAAVYAHQLSAGTFSVVSVPLFGRLAVRNSCSHTDTRAVVQASSFLFGPRTCAVLGVVTFSLQLIHAKTTRRLMLEYWKRRQKHLALEWGMTGRYSGVAACSARFECALLLLLQSLKKQRRFDHSLWPIHSSIKSPHASRGFQSTTTHMCSRHNRWS